MGVFFKPEWTNFIRVACTRPWDWFGYAIGLLYLVFRRFSNKFYIKLMGKGHSGLKRWPEWLARGDYKGSQERGELIFPNYARSAQISFVTELPKLYFDANDPEGYFAHHRWGVCLMAALEEESLAKIALDEALSWIRNAPEKQDAAWETYSSCERVVNLAVMLAAHPNLWVNLDTGKKKEITLFFVESSSWIMSHLEYYGIKRTNNHILNNARALVVMGSLLCDEVMVERGLIIFSHMAKNLFQSGGFLRERSSHYQCVVTNWLMDTLHFAHSLPMLSPRSLMAMSELEGLSIRVATATNSLVAALDGLNTHIGDISPDSHPTTTLFRLRILYPHFFLEIAACVDKRQDDWLFVSSGRHQLITCVMPSEYPFDYATHGHTDLGSFVWSYNRCPLLVDSGRTSYVSNEMSRIQCGHIGHNMMTVNGLSPLSESLLTNGYWRPKPYAKAIISFEHKNANSFIIRHNGFSRISGVKDQMRVVHIISDGIEVEDTLEGVGNVEIDMYWHFSPEILILQEHSCAVGGAELQIHIEEESGGIAITHWEEYPYASAYGNIQKAYMRHTKRSVSLPWTLKTTMKVISCAE